MPNPYPTELRTRAVRAYETGDETCEQVAAHFEIGVATLDRWLRRQRREGTLDPLAKGGGWRSPIEGDVLRRVIAERPDRTTEELTREYNRQVAPAARVHRSSILRALQRFGYVFKKNDRGRRNSIVRGSKPAESMSATASERPRPSTSGTLALRVDTVIVTVAPAGTRVRALGLTAITRPGG